MKEKTFKSHIVQEEEINPFEIIVRNGWSTDLVQFNYDRNTMKQSVTLGCEQNRAYEGLSLEKLEKLGKNIKRSFMPVEEEPSFEN